MGCIRSVRDSYTRPANTDAYTAGDAVSNSTTAPVALHFQGVVGNQGHGGTIVSAIIVFSTAVATEMEGELWLFNAEPTAVKDADPFSISDPEALTVVAIIPFTTNHQTALNGVYALENLQAAFQCADGSKDLWGLVATRNAYVPASAEVLTFTLMIEG